MAVSLSMLGFTAVSFARAHAAPRVSFKIAAILNSTNHVHITYATKNVTKSETVVFQRRQGGWHTLKTLRRTGHSAVLAPFPIGQFQVRVAVLKNRRVVKAAPAKTVKVYGDIPLKNICNASNVEWGNNDEGCNSSTAEMGQFLFSSEVTFDAPGTANNTPARVNITISSTSCRSMHLDYGESNADQEHAGGSEMITQTIVQSKTAPSTTTFPGGAEQHIDINLDGGPVQITDTSSTAGEQTLQVLENGTLNCYTSNGVVPGT